MTDLDLAFTSAGDMARLVASGEVSPVELIDNSLARIDDINPELNAFCFVWAEEARAAAADAAAAVSRGDTLGPLHGVPIALKDTTPTKGHRTTFGSYCFENNIPDADSSIVVSLREAGAIVVGKTTSPEFAHSLMTDSPLWGPTRNPWGPDRTPGGSSGGSGVAVATGCVPLAEGSDMGGSVRIPAGWCGVVGLKPGIGRIPMDALPALFDSISHHGPLARNVDDARLFLAATQGPDPADIQSVVHPLDLSEPIEARVKGAKFAVDIGLGGWYVEPGIERALRATADALADAGAEVTEVHLEIPGSFEDEWDVLWQVFMATYFSHFVDEFEDRMTPAVLRLIRGGQNVTAAEYKRVEFIRTELWNKLRPVLAQHDALLTATMSTSPVGAKIADMVLPPARPDGLSGSPDMTAIWNHVAQCPALTVPCGLDDAGFPVGAQLIGQRWRSDQLLALGAGIEAVMAPIGRPPI